MSNNYTAERDRISDTLLMLGLLDKCELSDKSASNLYSAIYEGNHRYNATAGEWYCYRPDDGVWTIDREGLEARQDAKILYDALRIAYAKADVSEERLKSLHKWVGQWSQARFRQMVVNDARDDNYFCAEDLDKDDNVLNCENGVLHLDKDWVAFADHSPSDLLSKKANVKYDPTAQCERWERFVDEVMEGDGEKIKYLQKLFGLCLTGDTSEEKLWFLFGPSTRNGKSCMVETISYLLGDYALSMKPETLAVKANNDSRQANGDIARLQGVRLVVVSEPPKKMSLDTALVKSLTGRDVVVARQLYQSEVEFVPVCKVVCNTNYLPVVSDSTIFKSDRVQVVTFNRHFSEEEQDKGLKKKLREPSELSGILNWCIGGLRLYWAEGLEAPESVKAAVADYEAGSDKMGNFLTETLERKPGHNITTKGLYSRYVDWCRDNGYGIENKGNFNAELRGRGGFRDRGVVDGKWTTNVLTDVDYRWEIVAPTQPMAQMA